VAYLVEDGFTHRPIVAREQHDPADARILRRDVRREIATEAVAEHEDAGRVHPRLIPRQRHRRERVLDGLLVQGGVGPERPDAAPLEVAQRADASLHQPLGEIAKRPVGSDGLVRVVIARPVHEHHDGKRTLAIRQREDGGQLEGTADDVQRPGRARLHAGNEESDDVSAAVDGDPQGDARLLEPKGRDAGSHHRHRLARRLAVEPLEGAGRAGDLGTHHLPQHLFGERRPHADVEPRVQLRIPRFAKLERRGARDFGGRLLRTHVESGDERQHDRRDQGAHGPRRGVMVLQGLGTRGSGSGACDNPAERP
jgi:hypothetical protein